MDRYTVSFPVAAILPLLLLQAGFAGEPSHEELLLASECGSLDNPYGPFDYTNASHFHDKLPAVEAFHFNSDVESLRRGMTAKLPGGDLDYTLRAFPNHHRALYSMGRYALRYPNIRVPPGAHYPGECYFHRAIQFRPGDAIAKVVYGIFLSMQERHEDALAQFKRAEEIDANNAEVHYNLGLLYEKIGKDTLALQHAHRAYELDYPLAGLRNILKRKGVWRDKPEAVQEDP